MKSRKGVALVVSVVLSLLALTFIGVLLYIGTQSTRVSGLKREYTSALEVCKGVANYLMTLMDRDELCSNTIPPGCAPNTPINLGSYSNFGEFQASATLLRYIQEDPANPDSPKTYAVRVEAHSTANPSDRAEVEFVYRVHF